eukprot:CAMPEP_0115840288 /NCGR_PEP_ID=MMETSP0287-20121206/6692_1 /TAXON_ID=412157 /ORGANISM="Chrysochromulina rotalis, Strain UIO044" /LENGTH=221 /DNA_ID=CAMNT_0003293891 /DNA_START=38 /DNA_END=704 /DNA_ORIENTATION=+
MSIRVITPVTAVDAPNLKIVEYFGRVASENVDVSACLATVTAPCEEAPQAPAFDEYVLILEGSIDIWEAATGKTVTVEAGQGFVLPAHTRVKWSWRGPCKYVPICLPAFSIENCGRDADRPGVATAKSGKPLEDLKALHAQAGVKAATKDQPVNVKVTYEVQFGFWWGLAAGGLLGATAVAFFADELTVDSRTSAVSEHGAAVAPGDRLKSWLCGLVVRAP